MSYKIKFKAKYLKGTKRGYFKLANRTADEEYVRVIS